MEVQHASLCGKNVCAFGSFVLGFGSSSLLPHMRTILDLAEINKNLLNCCWLVALGKDSRCVAMCWSFAGSLSFPSEGSFAFLLSAMWVGA